VREEASFSANKNSVSSGGVVHETPRCSENEAEINLIATAILEFVKGRLVPFLENFGMHFPTPAKVLSQAISWVSQDAAGTIERPSSHQAIRFMKHENRAHKSNVLW
jgi:hypothetical protein